MGKSNEKRLSKAAHGAAPHARWALVVVGLITTWGVLRAQRPFNLPRPFQEYPGYEYNNFPVPDDYLDKHEWTRARLKYTPFINVHGISGRLQSLDGRLSALGPAFAGRRPAADADRHKISGAAGRSGRRGRCLQLAVYVRGGSGLLEPVRRRGEAVAGVSAARRILHVRRFPRHGGVGKLHGGHEKSVSRSSGGGFG